MNTQNQAPLVIYQQGDHPVEVRLDAEQETVWLSLQQLSEVFGRDKSVISRHLSNIYKEGELERGATVAKNATVQTEGLRQVRRQIELYNLDAIISVGYRVNSRRAVQFRQWATRVLREHLTQGWTLSRHRFEENARELEAAMALVRKTAGSPALDTASGRGLIDIVTRYAQTFLLLQRYDEGLLTEPHAQAGGQLPTVEEARTALASLKVELAYLFVDFLYRNDRLLNEHGEVVVNDVGLAALTLLIAESDPANKETMIRLIMNMLART